MLSLVQRAYFYLFGGALLLIQNARTTFCTASEWREMDRSQFAFSTEGCGSH